MDIHTVRQQLRTRSLYDLPLRVTYYARVSSESDEQLNSLGNQVQYYESLIRKNTAWTFVPGYIDEGLSAATTKKRENFHRMIADGEAGIFDLILTKEITRFARNTLDSIQYTRQLLSAGVGVFFQNDNINTLDEDSELRLTIMSGIAQDELRKLSSRVKFGHQQAIKNSVVLGNSRIFGYRKDGGRLVIDESQAPMVRELFELYATDQYSMKQLETLFWEKGYRNLKGKKILHNTMSNMISNPKYKGYYVGNKVKVVDMFTKKQKFLPPEEWVMFKDETGEIVPALVSEALWEQANDVLRRRSEDVKSRQGKCSHSNLLTGKLYCTHCGAPYYRRDSKDRQGNINSKWVCSGKINNGADSCPSFHIYEREIKPLLFEVFQDTEADVKALIEEYIEMYKEMADNGELPEKIQEQQQIIDLAVRKKGKLLEYNVTGQISDADFLSMSQAVTREMEEAQTRLDELREQQTSSEEFQRHIEDIRSTLRAAARDAADGLITKEFVDQYIDKIFATPEDGNTMRLEIKIFTGESTEKFLQKLRRGQLQKTLENQGLSEDDLEGRTGHTFNIMIQGTMSGVGKSLVTAGLCRIFRQDGYHPAPFKSQNMALNSCITRDGLEMGRAQAVQAAAAGLEPDVRMNPILLKPSSDTGSQVIVMGRVRGEYSAGEYFARKRELIPTVKAAYDSLAADCSPIVIEGAGSPAEINLRQDDIVNMGLAELVDAPVLLVGDIDRGGVFAQLVGTVELLEPGERARTAGFIINKFRGDPALLASGLDMLEARTGIPVLGVIPYADLDIDDEDSLSPRLDDLRQTAPVDIAVIRLPRISNFTDFAPLDHHPNLSVRYVTGTDRLGNPDLVILPGTKSTASDLLWMRQNGLEAAVCRLARSGTPVLGVCGGYQMLGESLLDPCGVEGGGTLSGMGLLPCRTTFLPEKRRTRATAQALCQPFTGAGLEGYEIHMGSTDRGSAGPFCRLSDGTEDGAFLGSVFGTYLHGLFDSGELTDRLAAWLRERKGIRGTGERSETHRAYLDRQLDRLADVLRAHLDLPAVYRIMENWKKGGRVT